MTSASDAEVNAFVGLGSNLDNPVQQIRRALSQLEILPGTSVVAISSLYRSAPFGDVEQSDFVNAVAHLQTRLDAESLLQQLLGIESAQGRVRGERWGPRIIDLDLLVHGDTISDSHELKLPHPGIAERNFVLLPLQEIAPETVLPGLGKVADIAVDRNDPQIARLD